MPRTRSRFWNVGVPLAILGMLLVTWRNHHLSTLRRMRYAAQAEAAYERRPWDVSTLLPSSSEEDAAAAGVLREGKEGKKEVVDVDRDVASDSGGLAPLDLTALAAEADGSLLRSALRSKPKDVDRVAVKDSSHRSLRPVDDTQSDPAFDLLRNAVAAANNNDNDDDDQVATNSYITKTVVMGKLQSDDTSWVASEVPDWSRAIYIVDLLPGEKSPTGFRTKQNKANEALPYLSYIVEHYPNFTDVVAFIHPHRNVMPASWHTDARNNDAKWMLRDLQLQHVLETGYVNLRCITADGPGCPAEIQPWRLPPDPGRLAEQAYPYLYASFFDSPLSLVRKKIEVVATPCCAQFAVSRQQILAHSRATYERILKTLETTHYDDATAGTVMEYMWHVIFGREAVHCPDVYECYCAVYGRCRTAPGRMGRQRERGRGGGEGVGSG